MQNILENKNSSEERIDISRYLKLVIGNLLGITFFAFMVTAIAVLVVLQITPKYTATATLLIEAQEKKAISIQEVVGIDSTRAEYYKTQFEILKSNQIAEKVIESLGLKKRVEFNAALDEEKGLVEQIKEIPLIASLLKKKSAEINEENTKESIRQNILNTFKEHLSISPVRNTQLVKISFTSKDPELASEVANAVGYAYIESNLESRLTATEYASSWITGRLTDLRSQLQYSEQALNDFLIKEKLIDDSGIQTLASQELTNLTTRLADVRDQRIATESAYSALTSSKITDVASLSAIPAISQHPQVIAVRDAELKAINEVKELAKRYGPKHDKMQAAQAKLDSVEAQARQVTEKLISGIGKELQALRKQEQLLASEINGQKSQFQELTLKRSQYEALQREVETNRNLLNVFLTRQKETTATQDFNSTNARFTDEALVPQFPSEPKKKLIVALVFVASLVFAIVMIFLVDSMKNTIESARDFEEKLGLIPLGAVPMIKAKQFKKVPLNKTVFFDERYVSFNESIRSIRTSLMLSFKNSSKSISITSSLPEEGKTTVSINLAMSFAKVENVLLIDCDLRKSSISERFGLKKYHQGLANYLSMGLELEDCLFKDEQSRLTVLPAGMYTQNPQELLSSRRFKELLEKLENSYDRIIIDTPPILPVSDSLIISQLTKAVVIIVKANGPKVGAVKMTMEKFISHNIGIHGVVVNKIDIKKSNEEKYSYGSYSNYGDV